MRQARADELSVDSGIVRHGGAAQEFNSVKLIGEFMLNFEAK